MTKTIDGVLFECDLEPDLTGMSMYLGLYEPLTVRAMRRLLTKGDTLIDVGANIGYLSAVGASLVGPTGSVHCFEPVPRYFQRLRRLAEINPGYTIVANQLAAGDGERTFTMHTSKTSLGGNTMISGLNREEDIEERFEVRAIRLDEYIRESRLAKVALIKIDVEGFEFPVLRGLQRYLDTAAILPAIICEIAPTAYPLLGYTLSDLRAYMEGYGYRPFRLNAIGKAEMDITALESHTNMLFVPGPNDGA